MKHSLAALVSLSLVTAASFALAATPQAGAPKPAASRPAAKAAKVISSETLSNGVVVQHTKTGTGANPSPTDTVTVNYRGTFDNGEEFDSSAKHGKPISFPLNGVIPCWTEGVQKLKVGGSAMLTCPPQTAYGPRGIPGVVPPNSTLHFDVELLAIKK
jgi:FKBP-type peptidyl-prolyl cis-trans isomerase FkpA